MQIPVPNLATHKICAECSGTVLFISNATGVTRVAAFNRTAVHPMTHSKGNVHSFFLHSVCQATATAPLVQGVILHLPTSYYVTTMCALTCFTAGHGARGTWYEADTQALYWFKLAVYLYCSNLFLDFGYHLKANAKLFFDLCDFPGEIYRLYTGNQCLWYRKLT